MTSVKPRIRQTKYCTQIEHIVAMLGHGSNADIQAALQRTYPDVSATTVHRATARLASRRRLSVAPPDLSGAMRYDVNVTPHDHFMCSSCGILRDVDIASKVRPLLEAALDGCLVSGQITVSGICKKCARREA